MFVNIEIDGWGSRDYMYYRVKRVIFSTMSDALHGYIVVVRMNRTPELVPIPMTCNSLRFGEGQQKNMKRRKNNLVLSSKHTSSNEIEIVARTTQDVQIMIESRVDEIQHHRANINRLVVQACNDPESKSVRDELSLCCDLVHNHLLALKHPDLLLHCIESVDTIEETTITLRPGKMTEIGAGITVLWTPCRSIPSQTDVVTTHTNTISSSLVPIIIPRRIRLLLEHTIDSFDIE